MQEILKEIKNLYRQTFNEDFDIAGKLPVSGSARIYYRLKNENRSVLAAYNKDKKENLAFTEFSKIFREKGINVPRIFSENLSQNIYLLEDLGDNTLFEAIKKEGYFSENIVEIYKKTLEQLTELQISAGNNIDYSLCYPRNAFDKQSIMWDLNYFKYNFLKFTDVLFDEQLLEDDFNTLTDYLLGTDCNYFLFRDFQSRNIMLKDDRVYFVDYQGGRKGALQYDIASLLYDAKAGIPEKIKTELLNYYINCVQKYIKIDRNEFIEYFYAYALIRVLQAFGAYGFRGLYEKKQHFIDSIKPGLKNLSDIAEKARITNKLPELRKVINMLSKSDKLKNITDKNKLTVTIKSFSYKRGIPYDNTGNGGGFVFDCRFINNPGRIEKYRNMCGKDKPVIDFLEKEKDTSIFSDAVKKILSAAVNNYISRDFKNLSVSFGCTGGQHRSVYFAEKITEFLTENFDININLIHTEGF